MGLGSRALWDVGRLTPYSVLVEAENVTQSASQ